MPFKFPFHMPPTLKDIMVLEAIAGAWILSLSVVMWFYVRHLQRRLEQGDVRSWLIETSMRNPFTASPDKKECMRKTATVYKWMAIMGGSMLVIGGILAVLL